MEIFPKLEKFKSLAERYNIIVLSHKFYSDWLTPLAVYYGLSKNNKQESFLLESVEGQEKICRFSFIGVDPLYTFESRGLTVTISGKENRRFKAMKNPLDELRKFMKQFKAGPVDNIRFFGGVVGFCGYDMVRFFEPIGKDLPDTIKTPDMYFVLPKYLVIFDHLKHQVEVLSFVCLEKETKLSQLYLRESGKLELFCEKISKPFKLQALKFKKKPLKIKSNFRKKDFCQAVSKAKEHIRRGDIIQAVLSQRFSVKFQSDPFEVYRYLRVLNPSPYMFYLNLKGLKVCGASPEMLIRLEKGVITTRPIAGTRPRGKTEDDDRTLEKDLLNDPKERAEHIMLVDLSRNDLGRVAKKASVEVPVFMTVERFSHVMHIVSEVRAEVSSKSDMFSALSASFPAGTLSGAPKVRAMQIINELEPDKRGVYGGCVGYFSFTNSLDTCIIIRTIVFKDGFAYIQAGAGIVNDSVPEAEYKETVNKAKAAFAAVSFAL
ncbi:MAG: anthranilate synthase component I [Candidatus Omnitrophica bacterium]|nr:anthranilate synthase component I [Candidatus Omnitrophota bacterium]